MKRLPLFALAACVAVCACDYETIASLTPPQSPESVGIEPSGSVVAVSALTGEVLRVDPDTGATSTLAVLPLGQCAPNPFPPIAGALAIDDAGSIYVNANACDPANRGVWKINPVTGAASVHVPLPPNILANGLAIKGDGLFIADTFGDTLYRAPLSGGPAVPFATSPLLAPTGAVFDPTPGQPGDETPLPGSNGVQRYGDGLLVANSSSYDLVFIDDAGAASVLATAPIGCDDFAVDVKGDVLCTTDAFQTVLAISPDGRSVTILDAADPDTPAPLDGPTAVVCEEGGHTCYVSNAAFPFFPGTGNGPSIGAFEWKYRGAPR